MGYPDNRSAPLRIRVNASQRFTMTLIALVPEAFANR